MFGLAGNCPASKPARSQKHCEFNSKLRPYSLDKKPKILEISKLKPAHSRWICSPCRPWPTALKPSPLSRLSYRAANSSASRLPAPNHPSVILADEPAVSLDSERVLAVVRILNQMARTLRRLARAPVFSRLFFLCHPRRKNFA